MVKSLSLSVGKCWQTPDGVLVFQASTFDGQQRRKGFLELSSRPAEEPVQFKLTKNPSIVPHGGVAMLIRKHLSSGSLVALAINDQIPPGQSLRLTMQGKAANADPSQILIVIERHSSCEIVVIKDGMSLARFKQGSQYTMTKKALPVHIEPEDLPQEGFQRWLHTLVYEDHQSSNAASDEQITESLAPYQREARDRLNRRLRTLKKTYIEEQKKLPLPDPLQSLKRNADLLQRYLWMVQPESFALELDAALTGDKAVQIPLDPDLSPGENLETLYKNLKKLERAISMGQPRLDAMKAQIQSFEHGLQTLREKPLTINQVQDIIKNLGLTRDNTARKIIIHHQSQRKSQTQQPTVGRLFRASSGDKILLGRNATESDAIVKSAKSEDWWLHVAGGGHGSHVIIPGQKHRDTLPTALLREAAILALHFSDRSGSREGEVYISRRRNLKKRKGMAPGLWQIQKAETVMIRYSAEELSAIFSA
jgi:predicted ribosome quality control (RQC) complex YloA/Tae2 family protein